MHEITPLTESKYSQALSCFFRRRGKQSFTDEWFTQHTAQLLPKDELSILSIGCGAGSFDLKVMDILNPYKKRVDYVGVDPNNSQINRFRQLFTKRSFKNTSLSLENCGIEDFHSTKRFDLVHFTHCLYHIQDRLGSIQKAIGLLHPQGKVLIFNDDLTGIQQIRSEFCELMNVQLHQMFSYKELGKLLMLAGITYDIEQTETMIDVTPCFDNDSDEGEMLLSFLVDADFEQLPTAIQLALRKYLFNLCIKQNDSLLLPHRSWVLLTNGN